MRKYYVFIIISLIAAACNNDKVSSNTDIAEDESVDTIDLSVETKYEGKAMVKETGSILDEIIKNNTLAVQQLNLLRESILLADSIKSIVEVDSLLEIRDGMIRILINDTNFESAMDDGGIYFQMDNADKIDNELEEIGIRVATLEGMYAGLIEIEFLDEIIERVADEPYRIYNKIKILGASSSEGEYPYMDISEDVQIILLAEKVLTEYPNYKYNKEIAGCLERSLVALTDVHMCSNGFSDYVVGGFDVSAYPGATDISAHETFISENRNSRFATIVSKIIKNMSIITSAESDVFYIVEVPSISDTVFADSNLNMELSRVSDYIKGDKFKYLWLGVDIAHELYLRDGDSYNAILAYRFYDTRKPAEESLKVIQEIIPSARLTVYELTEKDKEYRN